MTKILQFQLISDFKEMISELFMFQSEEVADSSEHASSKPGSGGHGHGSLMPACVPHFQYQTRMVLRHHWLVASSIGRRV